MSSELNEIKVGAIWRLAGSKYAGDLFRVLKSTDEHGEVKLIRVNYIPSNLATAGFYHPAAKIGVGRQLVLYKPSTYISKLPFVRFINEVRHFDLINEFKELLVELEI